MCLLLGLAGDKKLYLGLHNVAKVNNRVACSLGEECVQKATSLVLCVRTDSALASMWVYDVGYSLL